MAAPLPSDRSFGMLFAGVLALWAAYSWWNRGEGFPWAFGLSAVTLAVTLVRPRWLRPANRAWTELAALLNRVTSPLILAIIFYAVFTPAAVAMRLAGRDAMKRRFDPAGKTYWVERNPPGPDPAGLPNQF